MKNSHKILAMVGMFILTLLLLKFIFNIGAIVGSLAVGIVIGYYIGKKYS
tara:strand:+ start:122 stop:271 length:150 start_codon:yes stop_codon:yes gene_type:complete